MNVLERAPILITTDLNLELAREAEAILGYSAMRRHLNAPGPLAIALAELEIEPFTAESVEAQLEATRQIATERNRKDFPGTQSSPEWQRFPISQYKGLIPQHVLSRAVAIARAQPYAELWVEALGGDPFLVVTRGEEEFYVDVWDEAQD